MKKGGPVHSKIQQQAELPGKFKLRLMHFYNVTDAIFTTVERPPERIFRAGSVANKDAMKY